MENNNDNNINISLLCKKFRDSVIDESLKTEKFKPTLDTIYEKKVKKFSLSIYVKSIEYQFFTTQEFINDPCCYQFVAMFNEQINCFGFKI